jgi:VanZ family protein
MPKKIILTLPLILASVAIFYMSHQPNVQLPDFGFDFIDKVLHFAAYFVYGVAVLCAAVGLFPEKSGFFVRVVSFIYANIFAISDEFHQSFIDGRFADFGDWLADSIGIAAALLLLPLVLWVSRKL